MQPGQPIMAKKTENFPTALNFDQWRLQPCYEVGLEQKVRVEKKQRSFQIVILCNRKITEIVTDFF